MAVLDGDRPGLSLRQTQLSSGHDALEGPSEGSSGAGRKAMSIKSTWGRILLSGASIAAIGATPALAQQAQTGTPAATASEEVVVTATGRQAAIQDVPIAVTAV